MAIKLDLTNSNFGVPFNGAYFRIVNTAVSRTRQNDLRFLVMIDVVGYANKPDNEETRDVDFRRYHVPYNNIESQTGENFLAKCYAWVMKQPDMTGSIGV